MKHEKTSREGSPEAIERYERLLERLARLAQALAASSELVAVYRALLGFVRESAPCNGVFVALYEPQTRTRHAVYAWSEGREEDVGQLPPLPLTESPQSRAVRTGQVVVNDDFQGTWPSGQPGMDLGLDVDPRLPQSSIAVPMLVMGRVIGAMEIQSVEPAAYGPEHVTALRMAAHLAGMATENVRLLEEERGLRRRAEDSERRKAAILESALDAIVTIDGEGRIVEFNPAAERMFGRARADVIGAEMGDLIVPASLRERHRQGVAAHGAQRKPGTILDRRVELPALRADGTEFPAEVHVTRIGEGEPAFFTGFIRDLTDLKRAERARESLEAQLRESQKMEAMGTLAGGIAHGFNNIVAAILGNAELARQEAGAHSPAMKSLREIERAADRARDLVHHILSFSRRQATVRSRIALPPIVEASAGFLRAILPAGIAVDWSCAMDCPEVLADPNEVQQVLLNLGTNAAHAMRDRPGSIDIRVERVEVDETAARQVAGLRSGTYARISVADAGIGMDAATLSRIFEPFFTTKEPDEGSGLGLAVAHGIMRVHGGAIAVRSEPGKGSRFELYFPAAQAAGAIAPKAPAVAAGVQAARRRVLYIDDDEALIDLYSRMLKRAGHEVAAYVDSREALAVLAADPGAFDVVVTDFNMPRMSGLQVAGAVLAIRPDMPVAVVTGHITEELRAKASEAGVCRLIFKPDAVQELPDLLRSIGAAG